jgi:branched-chain amino acid aminotransferase
MPNVTKNWPLGNG